MKKNIRRCKCCGLPEQYPGIQFSKDTICNYCVYFDMYKDREELIVKQLKEEFSKAIRNAKRKKQKYDCIVAYSGGKDSTYLLYFLKRKLKLNVLAHSLDNGFISSTALKNIKMMTKVLNIDCRITKPKFDISKSLFAYALTEKIPYPSEILAMMSQVCAVCIGMVFGTTINLATKLKIPLLFIGFTPGQYPAISLENFLKVKSCMFLSYKVYRDDPLDVIKIVSDPVREKFGEKVNKYFFKSQYYSKGLIVPKVLFPYHALLDYDENKIVAEIEKLGWKKPQDTDSCSTNCLLNTVGNYACIKQRHYHPYIGEMSYLVRKRKITRDEAIEAEIIEENSYAMNRSLERLNITKRQIQDVGLKK